MPRKPKRDMVDNFFECSEHSADLRILAKHCLEVFLSEKTDHKDQPINKGMLLSDENIKLVLRTPFDDFTLNFIHNKCLSQIPKQPWYRDKTVPWNVHYLLGLLVEMRSLMVPKEFQPGLLLLYFKFCKGHE